MILRYLVEETLWNRGKRTRHTLDSLGRAEQGNTEGAPSKDQALLAAAGAGAAVIQLETVNQACTNQHQDRIYIISQITVRTGTETKNL